jgi:lysophospholipase L1-like esterase
MAPHKTILTIAAFLGVAALPEFAPLFKNYKFVSWDRLGNVLDFQPRPNSIPEIAEAERLRPELALRQQTSQPLIDDGNGLDHFYESLRKTEAATPGAVTRILHYGDSPTTADLITADMRTTLQAQYGNAGHGFALIAKPWAWYGHRGIDISGSGLQISPANQPGPQSSVKDGIFGLGGVSFLGAPGATSNITVQDGSHTAIEVAYLQQPGGGTFKVLADGRLLGEIDTNGPASISAFAEFAIPQGAKHFEIIVTRGAPRLFGVQFLKAGPGVLYSSLGLNGAYISVLSKMFRPEHWQEQLRHYKPDLVIINYGTNESVYAAFVDRAYTKEIREAIRRVRAAVPEASILIMSPMDRGERELTGEIGTVPALSRLVTLQQKAAAELGCGFFNTFQAMGGQGTMGRWYGAEPRLVSADFIHPMPGGAKVVGNLLYRGLMSGYYKYKLKRMRVPVAQSAIPQDVVRPN